MTKGFMGLALVAVMLMLSASSGCATKTAAGPAFYGEGKRFTRDLADGKVASVKADTSAHTLAVQLTDGSSYTVPYPTDLATVDKLLRKHPGVSYRVDGEIRQ